MLHSHRFTTFGLIFSLASLALSQRYTFYSRTNSTCVKDDTLILLDSFHETYGIIKVQPNCDDAINAVCSQALIAPPQNKATYTATAPNPSDPEACQVHLVGLGTANKLPTTYETCVEGFQSITIDCMLLGYGRSAEKGVQAGVRGVYVSSELPAVSGPGYLTAKNISITADSLQGPGFLVGPPGYFGDVSVLNDGKPTLPIVIPL